MPKLTIITTHPNEHHATTEETQQSTNKPFKRHFQILDQLRNIYPKDNFVYVDEPINYIEKELRKYPCVDPTYLEFLKNAYISYCCSRHKHNNEDLQSLDHGLVNYCFSKNMNVDLSKIPYHVQCGIYGNDFCTSIFDHTYETALRSAYNGLVAANHLEKDSIIYCANVFPGHHASPKLYSGYCFLNNTAICAQRLLERYDRITILDIDFHAGDGTQRIFYKDRRVLTISIHADPTNEYPFYYGFANEVGEGDGENYNFNYPVDTNIYNISCDVYLQLLNQALDLIDEFETQVLIIAFGADTYQLDPEGGFMLRLEDYEVIGKTIRNRYSNKPIIVFQEGGYYLLDVASVVANFLKGISQ